MAPALRKRIVSMVIGMSVDISTELADDVAQDTLLKLWTIRDRLDEYRSIDSLAMVIARHRAIDLLRNNGVLTVKLDDADTDMSVPSPEENLIRSESAVGILEIINNLPSVQQTVIRMRHIEGMDIADIAMITGSTPASVRTALSRARHSIKELFMQRQ
ncbi:MAG: sigma-70 family RNA polymerase sigma factor [Bacteroides sp.]|nr:sigma-70 family RNA polymerase sigma factor [Bacteroides sp.]